MTTKNSVQQRNMKIVDSKEETSSQPQPSKTESDRNMKERKIKEQDDKKIKKLEKQQQKIKMKEAISNQKQEIRERKIKEKAQRKIQMLQDEEKTNNKTNNQGIIKNIQERLEIKLQNEERRKERKIKKRNERKNRRESRKQKEGGKRKKEKLQIELEDGCPILQATINDKSQEFHSESFVENIRKLTEIIQQFIGADDNKLFELIQKKELLNQQLNKLSNKRNFEQLYLFGLLNASQMENGDQKDQELQKYKNGIDLITKIIEDETKFLQQKIKDNNKFSNQRLKAKYQLEKNDDLVNMDDIKHSLQGEFDIKECQTNGNSFYRTMSQLIFDNENNHEYLRLINVFKMTIDQYKEWVTKPPKKDLSESDSNYCLDYCLRAFQDGKIRYGDWREFQELLELQSWNSKQKKYRLEKSDICSHWTIILRILFET